MPIDIKIVRPHEFVMTTAQDRLDFDASKALVARLAEQIEGPCAVLVDVRDADEGVDVLDLYRLCEALAAQPSLARCKTAMLAPANERTASPRFAQLVAEGRDPRLRAFANLDAET